jgi:hypothetical protein
MDVVGDEARSRAGGRVTAERFFTLVWRANALILLVVGVAGLLGLGAALTSWAIHELTRDVPPPPTHVAGRDVTRWNSRLGWVEQLGETSVLRIRLTTNEEIEGISAVLAQSRSIRESPYYGLTTQNFLYVDIESGAARWLLPGNDQIVVETVDLPKRDDGVPIVTVFAIVDHDTDENGKLGEGDESFIALAQPDGMAFTRLLDRVDELHASHLDGRSLSLLYTRAGVLRLARIELPAFRIASDIELNAAQQP